MLTNLIHSKQETDAGLLGVISYPAFAVDDQELIDHTRETIVDKLQVQYMDYASIRNYEGENVQF